MKADDTGPRVRPWTRELLGWMTALAIALATVAVVASTARSELLFRDADSLVTTLVVRSLASGQPQDWAMSSVLFLPEIAVLAGLSMLGLGVAGTLALSALVNLLALYGALRVVAGSAARSPAAVGGALLGLGAFALFAITETSPDRDALEPASLLLTTTYYSAAVVAVVLTIGLARRGLDRASGVTTRGLARPEPAEHDPPTPAAASGAPASGVPTRGLARPKPAEHDPRTAAAGRRWPAVLIAVVAAASVLTNPLFAAWATVPIALVLGFVALRAGRAEATAAAWLIAALVGGSAVGFVARMPLGRLIANTGAGYADPSRWLESLGYYAGLAAERWNSPWGRLAVVLGIVLWAWCIVASVVLARRRRDGALVVAACGWIVPLLVVVGAIALGTHAARYVQPIAFAPVLGLVVLPEFVRVAASRRVASALAAAAVAALVVAGGLGIPRIGAAASAPDADLDCVVEWTDASGRTGAGQFWTVRLAKAHLADPRRLVQVDHELRGYAWLVNRDDFAVGEVTFLVLDAQTVPFALPAGASLEDAELIPCGRYTIADFGERSLPLGPQRS